MNETDGERRLGGGRGTASGAKEKGRGETAFESGRKE